MNKNELLRVWLVGFWKLVKLRFFAFEKYTKQVDRHGKSKDWTLYSENEGMMKVKLKKKN